MFGHSIEAAALSHLKNLLLFLRRCGMQPSKPMVWRRVRLDASGKIYDIDQDLRTVPSAPTIERNDEGRIVRASGSQHQVEQIAKGMTSDGREVCVVADEPITLGVQQLRVTYPMDDDIKRLCIKMSVAVAHKMGRFDVLGHSTRSYLLEAVVIDPCPVRIAIDAYPDLDRHRPLAGHLIYVRANSTERRIYSIVQLFTFIQFYCELTCDYLGEDWGILATHNPVGHEETFDTSVLVDYQLPPRWVAGAFAEKMGTRFEYLRLELKKMYGDQAPTGFSDASSA